MTKAIPARRTRLISAVLWDHIVIPEEHAIKRPCRSDKLCPILGEYHPVDQCVDVNNGNVNTYQYQDSLGVNLIQQANNVVLGC